MSDPNQAFYDSLDLIDRELVPFLPSLLEDLWELGSMPDYILKLIQKHIAPSAINTITDLGCGKGAVLIKLALAIPFEGFGIDLVPAFIESARRRALEYQVAKRIKFICGDLKVLLSNLPKTDLLIYGYDADILGNVKESLLKLKEGIPKNGWIIFEAAYTPNQNRRIEGLPNESELTHQIKESSLEKVDRIIWDLSDIKRVNARNNELIGARVKELIQLHPDKKELFDRYMVNQILECEQIEKEMICSTWLLKK